MPQSGSKFKKGYLGRKLRPKRISDGLLYYYWLAIHMCAVCTYKPMLLLVAHLSPKRHTHINCKMFKSGTMLSSSDYVLYDYQYIMRILKCIPRSKYNNDTLLGITCKETDTHTNDGVYNLR